MTAAPTAAPARRGRFRSPTARQNIFGWLFVAPFFLVMGAINLYVARR